ncbi:I Gonadoliberin-1 Gonadoliberin [Collichthys lucidus]|uniref:Progonadoliberin n=1 Tax=Collichthys lucidus TaxID=240159 RepID=A0A4U5UVM9_COLLU|nr:I Gonadoliberin-1 Gonadoliberin [Collichthys lucidus]
MAPQTSAMLLLLVGSVLWCHGCCQHWSYGLSPGGKRDLDGRSDTMVDSFPRVDSPCSVLSCVEDFPKIYRMKGFLDGVTDRDNGRRTFKK